MTQYMGITNVLHQTGTVVYCLDLRQWVHLIIPPIGFTASDAYNCHQARRWQGDQFENPQVVDRLREGGANGERSLKAYCSEREYSNGKFVDSQV